LQNAAKAWIPVDLWGDDAVDSMITELRPDFSPRHTLRLSKIQPWTGDPKVRQLSIPNEMIGESISPSWGSAGIRDTGELDFQAYCVLKSDVESGKTPFVNYRVDYSVMEFASNVAGEKQ
jgi:hypothetical protein